MESIEELEGNLDFMQKRLAKLRRELAKEPLYMDVVKQDGNTVRRKNAAWEAYHDLMRTYLRTFNAYREAAKGTSRAAKVVKFEKFAKTMNRAGNA